MASDVFFYCLSTIQPDAATKQRRRRDKVERATHELRVPSGDSPRHKTCVLQNLGNVQAYITNVITEASCTWRFFGPCGGHLQRHTEFAERSHSSQALGVLAGDE